MIKGKKSLVGKMLNTGVTNLVGVGMIGATAGAVNSLPAGTAKNIAGIVPGLQSVALLGNNIKLAKISLGSKKGKKGHWSN